MDHVDTEQDISWIEYSGVYRRGNVYAGLHQFIAPELVRGRMKTMISDMNSDLEEATKSGKIDPVAFSAKYCHNFVNVHPFLDGNGRTCCLILNAMLLKYGGNLVCLGEQGDDCKQYVDIAVRAALGDDFDDDDEFKPKHYKELASFTLKHFTESMRKLVQVLKRKQ